eukprot:TRINITY_DN338_c0_g1_i6.p1 TRINITY_DN338_c0_g1~~TRINITY_DN338_c0_g1_i6.p1  ORF type:complete len:1435 (+),score=533.98 TRINITY_DN338_c0_g1_i6:70-4305(+)
MVKVVKRRKLRKKVGEGRRSVSGSAAPSSGDGPDSSSDEGSGGAADAPQAGGSALFGRIVGRIMQDGAAGDAGGSAARGGFMADYSLQEQKQAERAKRRLERKKRKRKRAFEVDGAQEVSESSGSEQSEDEAAKRRRLADRKQLRRQVLNQCHRKELPHLVQPDYEMRLRRVATKGVVRLFNAVALAQRPAPQPQQEQPREPGEPLQRKATATESQQVTKSKFLEMLKRGGMPGKDDEAAAAAPAAAGAHKGKGKGKGKGGKAKDGQDWGKLGGYGSADMGSGKKGGMDPFKGQRAGKDGKLGKDGKAGKEGKAGKDGKVGKDGKAGKDGKVGKDGKAGKDGKIKGNQGAAAVVPTARITPLSRDVECTTYVNPFMFNEKAPSLAARQAAAGDLEGQRKEIQRGKAAVTDELTRVTIPEQGVRSGETQDYITNVLPIVFEPGTEFHQYVLGSVTGDAEPGKTFKSRTRERAAFKAVIDEYARGLPPGTPFDYIQASAGIVFTTAKFPNEEMTLVRAPQPGDDPQNRVLQQTLTVQMTYHHAVSTETITQELITIFSSVLRECFQGSEMQKIGRTYFCPRHMIDPEPLNPVKKELWPGLYCALHPIRAGTGLGLTVDVVKKCMSVEDAWTEARKHPGVSSDLRSIASQAALKRMWEGQIMMTLYDDSAKKKRTMHVDQVIFTETGETPQDALGGKSLAEYFTEHYPDLEVPEGQPVLVAISRSRRDPKTGEQIAEKYLPSVLKMTGVPTRDPSTKAVREKMLRLSAVVPKARYEKINQIVDKIFRTAAWRQKERLWQLRLQTHFSLTPGMRLRTPQLEMARGESGPPTDQGSWNFRLGSTPAFAAMPYPPTRLLMQCSEKARQAVQTALKPLSEALTHYAGSTVQVITEPISNFGSADDIARGMDLRKEQADAFIICADQDDDDTYARVKMQSVIRIGKPSQVIRESTLADQKKLKAVTNKVATQVLVKLGNSAWTIKDCSFPDTMVTGISFHHAGSAESRRQVPSVAGVAASLNSSLSRYAMAECALEAGKTIASGLAGAFRVCLNQYVRANGKPPKHFIFFREGGSEGEVPAILLEEVQAIEEAIEAAGAKPSLAYFLVLKQSHVRLVSYQPTEGDQCNLGNPAFGALVDEKITHLIGYEFFLVSQKVDQGCATAVKYKCLKNELGESWTPDKFQSLAFNLTCMYYNWNGPIKVPAPCLYASRHARMFGDQLRDQGTLHQIKADSYLKWTNRCDYWSKIAQTKNAAQSDLDDWKANHQRLGEEIDALAKEKAAYIARVFDTDIYNHVLGVLRLAAEESDAAHAAAVQVFHDMTENGIAFDDTTKILLRNVCFGDSYYDNSDLLMSHIEYPERGEHTLGKDEDLHQVSAIVLDVIGKRHKIDVHGPGVVLRNEEKLLSPSLDSPGKKEIEA